MNTGIIHGSPGDYKTPTRGKIQHKDFIRQRIEGTDNKYKKYIFLNMLTYIIRGCRKDYYCDCWAALILGSVHFSDSFSLYQILQLL